MNSIERSIRQHVRELRDLSESADAIKRACARAGNSLLLVADAIHRAELGIDVDLAPDAFKLTHPDRTLPHVDGQMGSPAKKGVGKGKGGGRRKGTRLRWCTDCEKNVLVLDGQACPACSMPFSSLEPMRQVNVYKPEPL